MTDLALTPTWGPVFRLEYTTPALAHNAANAGAPTFGADGPMNLSPRQLGNRTEWLRRRSEKLHLLRALPLTTYELTAVIDSFRGLRIAANSNYTGSNLTTVNVPEGDFLIVNECRWPIRVIGPSGVARDVAARVTPNTQCAQLSTDALDTLIVGSATPPMRNVTIASITPSSVPAAAVTPVTIVGKGFLGTVTLSTTGASIAVFTVVDDTTITCNLDGPALGLAAGIESIFVSRGGAEGASLDFTVT